MAKLDRPTKESLDEKLTDVVNEYQKVRGVMGDKVIRASVSLGLKIRRRKYHKEDRGEFDRLVKEHPVFSQFCQDIGLEL